MLELPFPSASLSPNARVHWATRSRAAKKHREWARLATQAMGIKALTNRLDVVITAYPPSRRRMDDDNLIGRCKAYRDGIADALGVDDSRFQTRLQWGEPVKGGKVVFTLMEAM